MGFLDKLKGKAKEAMDTFNTVSSNNTNNTNNTSKTNNNNIFNTTNNVDAKPKPADSQQKYDINNPPEKLTGAYVRAMMKQAPEGYKYSIDDLGYVPKMPIKRFSSYAKMDEFKSPKQRFIDKRLYNTFEALNVNKYQEVKGVHTPQKLPEIFEDMPVLPPGTSIYILLLGQLTHAKSIEPYYRNSAETFKVVYGVHNGEEVGMYFTRTKIYKLSTNLKKPAENYDDIYYVLNTNPWGREEDIAMSKMLTDFGVESAEEIFNLITGIKQLG